MLLPHQPQGEKVFPARSTVVATLSVADGLNANAVETTQEGVPVGYKTSHLHVDYAHSLCGGVPLPDASDARELSGGDASLSSEVTHER